MHQKIILIIISLTILSVQGMAQQEILEDGDDVIMGNKLFTKRNSWITIGGGTGYYFERPQQELSFGMDVNVRILGHYLTFGYLNSGTNFITKYSPKILHDFHLAYGWRKENIRWNRYAIIGPSLCMGFGYGFKEADGDVKLEGFIDPGIYGEYQLVYKPFYDMGIGLALYGSACMAYQTVGVKSTLYLSTAFIGLME
jgi:hypothetical protein